jgi:type VI secretion system protein ImpH
MAAESGKPAGSLAGLLLTEGYAFDFFQAVRLLEKMAPDRRPVGHDSPPSAEAARFRAHISLSFAASSIYEVEPPTSLVPMPTVTVSFMGLTGPSGVMPRHYTELLMRAREVKGPERYVARDWFDLFNHRLISLFYRAWTKYRFWLAYERGEYARPDPDVFTECLYCFIGLGGRSFRNRLRIAVPASEDGARRERVLARVDDMALIYYAGVLGHRPRNAVCLERLLEDYFGIPIRVLEFQGQWLQIDPESQSQVGQEGGNSTMGANIVVGDRVWDIRSKIRIRLGPLSYTQFASFLPDQSPIPERKEYFKLMHLVRLYVGPELKVDVQLILKADQIPPCRMPQKRAKGARLGWDSWLASRGMRRDSEEAVFEGLEVTWVPESNASPSAR